MHKLPPLSYRWLSLSLFLPLSLCTFVCRPILSSALLLLPCFSLTHVFLSPLRVSPWLRVDISISLLAVVVGFCGLALLVVSLFVFWKLCWPIWRSKALSVPVENGLRVGFPEVPASNSPLPTECSAGELEKKYPLEVKANGRSSVKLLEAAMKISQTSPDIPAEVQTALREKLSQQAKIQRQTTEPTSSSRYHTELHARTHTHTNLSHALYSTTAAFLIQLERETLIHPRHEQLLAQRERRPDSLSQSSRCPCSGLPRVTSGSRGRLLPLKCCGTC